MARAQARAADWLDERTGYRRCVHAALDEPVPGGASFAYVFGSVLMFSCSCQLVTGVLLAMYYSPSAPTRGRAVAYIQDQVTLGWFIRGLHHHGASAMVIVAGLHLLQVAMYGAYKKPREVNWLVGVLMLGADPRVRADRLPAAVGPEGLLGDQGRDRDHGLGARSSAADCSGWCRAATSTAT